MSVGKTFKNWEVKTAVTVGQQYYQKNRGYGYGTVSCHSPSMYIMYRGKKASLNRVEWPWRIDLSLN